MSTPGVPQKLFRFGILLTMLLSFGSVHAIPVTITATNESSERATDFCIPTDGDGEDESVNFNSTQITSDYSITPFQSTHNITSAIIGKDSTFQNFVTGVTSGDEICFFFPNDPVLPGEEFSVVIEVNFLDGTEVNADNGLSGDVYFSYEVGPLIKVSQGQHDAVNAGLIQRDGLFFGIENGLRFHEPVDVRVVFANDQLTVFSAIPEPSTISLILLGLLWFYFRRQSCAPRPSRARWWLRPSAAVRVASRWPA